VMTAMANMPWIVALIPRAEARAEIASGKYQGYEFGRQEGTPYVMRRKLFQSSLGVPCVKPPWGTLTAVDMEHATIKWQIPLGVTPYIHMNLGMPPLGGPIVTGGGLVFVAASLDDHLRAFDTDSGKPLWDVKLPAGGQYLVIAAGGYKDVSTRGDYLVAYALPR